jgi:hypothetical protein
MKNVLILLTAVVLLSSSFTLNSCKQCDKKQNEPTDRGANTNNMLSDTTTGNSKTPSSSSGSSLTPPTSKQLKAAVVAKLNELLGNVRCFYIIDIPRDTTSPFLKATLESLLAEHSDDLNNADFVAITNVYCPRYDYALELCEEYIENAPRLKDLESKWKYAEGKEGEDRRKKADDASKRIEKMIKDNDESITGNALMHWREFFKVKDDADRMWKELCDVVRKDIFRPKGGESRKPDA